MTCCRDNPALILGPLPENLAEQACRHYNARRIVGKQPSCSLESDSELLGAVMVQFIQHELSNYDEVLEILATQMPLADAERQLAPVFQAALAEQSSGLGELAELMELRA